MGLDKQELISSNGKIQHTGVQHMKQHQFQPSVKAHRSPLFFFGGGGGIHIEKKIVYS